MYFYTYHTSQNNKIYLFLLKYATCSLEQITCLLATLLRAASSFHKGVHKCYKDYVRVYGIPIYIYI